MTSQKHIVINAATAAIGGGLIVAIDIIVALCNNPQYKITLICPDIIVYRKLSVDAERIYVPRLILKFYTRWWLDYVWLKKTIEKLYPDLIISLGNLPAITSIQQLMFNDNAFVSEKKLTGFNLTVREFIAHSIRKCLFNRYLRFVKVLIVQTDLEKNKFTDNYRNLPSIKCLAPLLPSHIQGSDKFHYKLPAKKPQQLRLGCLSYIHGHKNIGILSEVLDIAEKEKFHLQIVFTLSPANSLLSKKLKIKLKKHFISGTAINLGKIKPGQIGDLMHQLDGLILPSLNESYSLNYFEAIYFNKPLFVSDRRFAKEICGSMAYYFDPNDDANIYNRIVEVFNRKERKEDDGSLTAKYLKNSTPEDLYELINNNC